MSNRGLYLPWPFSVISNPGLALAVGLISVVLAIALIIVLTPFAIAAGIGIGIFYLVRWYMRRPVKTAQIYEHVDAERQRALFPTDTEFWQAYNERYDLDCHKANLTPAGFNALYAMLRTVVELYQQEGFTETKVPLTHVVEGSVQMGAYRDHLIDEQKKLEDPITTIDVFTRTLSNALVGLTSQLPEFVTEKYDREQADETSITVPLIDALGENGKQAIQYLVSPFFAEEVRELHLFERLFQQFEQNLNELDEDDIVLPTDFKGTAREALDQYLKFTPLKPMLEHPVPWRIPQEIRFEHQWIVAPQGAGKTQYMQYQITRDLDAVQANEASVVVMDSQGDLIKLISRLSDIPEDKLIVVEPDPEYPLALNPFDVGKSRLGTYDARTREMLDNTAISLLSYVFDNLLDTRTTPKQTALFQNVIRLCRALPTANIKTLAEILNTQGVPYPEYVDTLPEVSREFFYNQFSDPRQFKETKQELAWRLSLLRGNTAFERMFSHEHSKLDLFQELNSSKVILINTDKMLLKDKGTELFGRFFLALLLQASQERAALERSKRLPTYIYVDEAQDYIAKDTSIQTMLDQARKMNVSVTLAHQRTQQMDKEVLDALTNVSIKCARAVNDAGAHTLARNMGTTPEFISKQPIGHFAIALRNESAISIRIPPFVMEKMPKREGDQLSALKARMREKYATRYIIPEKPPAPQPKPRARVKDGRLVPADLAQEENPLSNPQAEAERPTNWPRG